MFSVVGENQEVGREGWWFFQSPRLISFAKHEITLLPLVSFKMIRDKRKESGLTENR